MGWSMQRPPGLTFHNAAASFKGYTLVTPIGGDSTLLIDMQGRVVHRWLFNDVRPEYAYLLENGSLLYRSLPKTGSAPFKPASEDDPPMPLHERARTLPSNYLYLREADWSGKTLWQYEHPLLHHDFHKTSADTYLLTRFVQMEKAASDRVRGDMRAKRGHHPLLTDEYVEVNAAGEELWSVRLDAVLDPKLDPIEPLERRIEWTHTNSICTDAANERVLFSCKNINRVGIIDKTTHKLVWRFGHPITSGQHHARWLPNGNIHIFDNGLRREGLPFSRVIEVNPLTDEIVWQYQSNPPFSFFSPNVSSADRLPNGNTLVCEGLSGRVFEVSQGGELVWEWNNPFSNTIRGTQITQMLWRAHRYPPSHAALQGHEGELDYRQHLSLNRMYGLVRD